MKSLLRILHLEDDPDDAELIRIRLEEEAILCEKEVVKDQDGFLSVLEKGKST